jgi:hypothetical protein
LVGEGFEITGAVEELVFQSEVTKQRGGDRLGLLNYRLARAVARPSAGVTTSGTPPRSRNAAAISCARSCAFVRVRRVRRQFFAHGFVAGLRLSSLRDLRLGVGELVQRAKLGDETDLTLDCGCVQTGHARSIPFNHLLFSPPAFEESGDVEVEVVGGGVGRAG